MLLSGASAADFWTATKLRGGVEQQVDGQWQPLARGDVVPDDRVVKTLANGAVSLTRGSETVELGASTQVQIDDKATTGKKPFTTVTQYFGSVAVEAEVENVQHFEVSTPFLAAVVKGTRFVVTSNEAGASVLVQRGHVAVEDHSNSQRSTINVGQSAIVGPAENTDMVVEGAGDLPLVVDASGKPLVRTPAQVAADLAQAASVAAAQATISDTPAAKAIAADAKKAADAGPKAAGSKVKPVPAKTPPSPPVQPPTGPPPPPVVPPSPPSPPTPKAPPAPKVKGPK
jgi:hypothetical protein